MTQTRRGLLLVLAIAALGSGPQRSAQDSTRKLDPFLRRVAAGTALQRALPPFVLAERQGAVPAVYAHARIDASPAGRLAEERLAALGVELRARVGEIVSLRVPVTVVERVAAEPAVRWLAAARSFELATDVSTGPAHLASDAATATFGVNGSGVIVAVVDTGIDWTNLDFRKLDGTTRILGIWDQTFTDPQHPPPSGFGFGAYYARGDIDAALQGGPPLTTDDVHGHGTHVAGIAAGSGRQTGNGVPVGTYAGVAPAADLVVVKVFEGAAARFCAACDLIAAVEFIRQLAAAAAEPWVVNMSLGSNIGAHDGTDAEELALDAATGPGRPGASAAIAAGNSGSSSQHSHWTGTLVAGVPLSNSFTLGNGATQDGADNDFVWLDLWYEGADRVSFSVTTPGNQTVSAAYGADSGIVCTSSGAVEIDATSAPSPMNGDNEVFVQVSDSSACDPAVPPQPGSWTIQIVPQAVASPGGGFDLWDAARTRGQSWVDLQSFSPGKSVTMPGTSRYALTAASYVSKNSWTNVDNGTSSGSCCGTTALGSRSYFSSTGPTRDGRIKPDIAAPGEWVASSIAAGDLSPPSAYFTERDGEHTELRGTSMAAPHAAGALALLAGINPALDAPHANLALERAARADSFTGGVPNLLYGHGKLRALEAAYEAASIVTDLRATPSGGFTGSDSPFIASYNVYRGLLTELSPANYGTCWMAGLASPDFTDAALPAPGAGFLYLVTGVYQGLAGSIEGPLGTDSAGVERRNLHACP